jgi:hypothetical protein
MKHIFLCLIVALSLSLPSPPASAGAAGAKSTEQEPGQDGDSRLPAGYRGVVWGAKSITIQAQRGRPLERQSTASSHVLYLIEAPLPGDKDTKRVIKWKLWDDALIEVQVHYEGPFNRSESRELVYKFESRYGAGNHEKKKEKQHYNWDSKTDRVVDEWWTWEDPFTTQMLKKNPNENSWTVVRKSRVLQANRDRQRKDERSQTKSGRVQSIDLD